MVRYMVIALLTAILGQPAAGQEPKVVDNLPGWVGAITFMPTREPDLFFGTSDGSVWGWLKTGGWLKIQKEMQMPSLPCRG